MRPNEYAQLKKENDRRFRALAGPDCHTVEDVMDSVRKGSWNLYEVERVRKDIIDMAQAAEQQGTTLAKALGPDRQALYDEIAREIDPGSFADYFWALGTRPLYLLHIALAVWGGFMGQDGVTAAVLALCLPCLLLGYLMACGQRRIWISRWPRARREMWIGALSLAAATCIITAVIWIQFQRLPRLTSFVIAALELLFYIVSYFVRRARYNRAAARRPWRGGGEAAGEDTGAQ